MLQRIQRGAGGDGFDQAADPRESKGRQGGATPNLKK
jgi:hypothetical protein